MTRKMTNDPREKGAKGRKSQKKSKWPTSKYSKR